jgi:hypothetical protein
MMKEQATSRALARANGNLKYPRSKSRPVMRPGKKMREYCSDPIHALIGANMSSG